MGDKVERDFESIVEKYRGVVSDVAYRVLGNPSTPRMLLGRHLYWLSDLHRTGSFRNRPTGLQSRSRWEVPFCRRAGIRPPCRLPSQWRHGGLEPLEVYTGGKGPMGVLTMRLGI